MPLSSVIQTTTPKTATPNLDWWFQLGTLQKREINREMINSTVNAKPRTVEARIYLLLSFLMIFFLFNNILIIFKEYLRRKNT